MNLVRRLSLPLALALVAGLWIPAVHAAAVESTQAQGPVSVTYQNPQQFTETRKSRPFVHDDSYLNGLKAYMQRSLRRASIWIS